MSPQPIARSDDLRRLRAEGFTLRVAGGKLVVDDVPYLDAAGEVRDDGVLVMPLALAGNTASPPGEHTAHFVGGVPHGQDGAPLSKIINNTQATDLGDGLVASCYLSAKPHETGRYVDYYQKVTVYVAQICGPGLAVDPTATPRRFRPVPAVDGSQGPFRYLDTASSRAGIDALNETFGSDRIAIVGLGGTGVYILDLVTKTNVAEIHIFDADAFLTHNAFRAPGAPTLSELESHPLKVDHFASLYDHMRKGVVPHPYHVDATNVDELRDMSFVFIAIDEPAAKSPIIEALLPFGVPFIDVGMGVQVVDGKLIGMIRTTHATPNRSDHVEHRVSLADAGADDEYGSNIQIAELNALNACNAVIRWKKYRGFYADLTEEHHSVFSVATNYTVNDDCVVTEQPSDDAEAA